MRPRHFVRVQGARVGTGCRLNEDLVLSAFHVLNGKNKARVFFDRHDHRPDSAEAEVVWQDEALDAVLLRWQPGDPIADKRTRLATIALDHKAEWTSRGAARVAVKGQTIADSLIDVKGEAYPTEDYQERLQLSLTSVKLESVDGWKGISGAPVMIRGWIYGIIRGGGHKTAGQQQYATPIHHLMDQAAFQQELGLAEVDVWKEQKDRIRKLLKDLAIAEVIAQQEPSWTPVESQAVADHLLGSPLNQAVERIDRAHELLHKKKGYKRASTIEAILLNLLPILFERQAAFSLSGYPGPVLLTIPVATAAVAEIVAAWQDLGSAWFREFQDALFPRPSLISTVGRAEGFPETGIDLGSSLAFGTLIDQLAQKLLPTEDILAAARSTAARKTEFYISRLRDELEEARRSSERRSRYLLFDSGFADVHQGLVDRLKVELPQLRLIHLQAPMEVITEERRHLKAVERVFRRAKEARVRKARSEHHESADR